MCIIVYKPKGERLDTEILQRCADKNPDGFGLVYPVKNGLRVCKTMNAEEWLEWASDPRLIDKPALLHARIATSGVVNVKTCHPFKIAEHQPRIKQKQRNTRACFTSDKPVMMHNGILRTFEPASKHAIESDSILFAEEYLEPLSRLTDLHGEIAEQLIEPVIDGSRVAIMTPDGKVSLYGNRWHESEGIYYSNTGYQTPAPRSYYGYDPYGRWREEDYWDWWTKRPTTRKGGPLEVIS